MPRVPVLLICLILAAAPAPAADLTKFTGVRLIDSPANDGDSFLVSLGERRLHARLYFGDCPETLLSTQADVQRVREQAQYFGVTDPADVVRAGRDAKAYTRKRLAEPFTLYTAFEDALGRLPGSRVYVFVMTADQKDLASELVERGLARAFGRRRSTPEGLSAGEMQDRLKDLEALAMCKRAGLWAKSDPEQMVRMRAEARRESTQIRELRKELSRAEKSQDRLDLNTAEPGTLQKIPGIGPALAARIVSGRPYRKVDDLLRVKGIGPELLERFRPYVSAGPAEDRNTGK